MTAKWIMALTPWAMIGFMLWSNRDVLWPKKEKPLPSSDEVMRAARERFDKETEIYRSFGRKVENDK